MSSKRNRYRLINKETDEDFAIATPCVNSPFASSSAADPLYPANNDVPSTSFAVDPPCPPHSEDDIDFLHSPTSYAVETSEVRISPTLPLNVLSDWNASVSSMEFENPYDDCSSDSSNGGETTEFDFEDFKTNLVNWAVTDDVCKNSVSRLLKVLKTVPSLNELPSDSRTLLRTPRRIKVTPLGNGEFVYFGLIKGIKRILSTFEGVLPTTIRLLISIDGLPISDSSRKQLWPHTCKISNLPESPVFPVGIFHGTEKPDDANLYLQQLTDELKLVLENGIEVQTRDLPIVVEHVGFVCDVPAKAFVLNIKGHAGFSSCTRCDQRGEYVARRVCMSIYTGNKRTHADFCQYKDKSYHNVGGTILTSLPKIDLVNDFSLDYMHLVCLGVVKKMILLWTKKDLKFRLSPRIIRSINKELEKVEKYIPSDFVRKPRSFDDASRWKATEFRQFLLYTGPVVLRSHLKQDHYTHFVTLHVAMTVLLSPKFCYKEQAYAKRLLKHFVKSFSKLYGIENISHNVHNLLHLADDVSVFGPLDMCSAFPFENFMQQLKKMVKKPNQALQQIAGRLQEKVQAGITEYRNKEAETKKPTLKRPHDNGPLVESCHSPQYHTVFHQNTKLSTTNRDNCCRLRNGKTIKVLNFATSGSIVMVIGTEIRKKENLFTNPRRSSRYGIFVGKSSKTIKAWPLNEVETKCIMMPFKANYVIFPLLHMGTQ